MAACKFTVAPHVATGPNATTRREFSFSQRGYRGAVDHAKTGDTTIFLVCEKGTLRIADCSEAKCRLGAYLGGSSSRALAGARRRRRR